MRSIQRWCLSVVLALVMLGRAPTAWADDLDALYEQGQAAFEAQKFEEARAKFAAVWVRRKSYDVAAVLAQAELQLGRHADAAQHLAYAVDHFPVSSSTDMRKKIEGAFAAVRAKVGVLKIELSPATATLKINSEVFSEADARSGIFVNPGDVHVDVTALDYIAASRTLHVDKGGETTVTIALDKLPPQGTGGPQKELVIAGAVVGGVAAITGGVLLGLGVSQQEALRADAPKTAQGGAACSDAPTAGGATATCDDIRSRARTANAMGQAGVGLLIGGGVAGAATVLYALWPRPTQQTATRLVPIVGPSSAGLLWTGSF